MTKQVQELDHVIIRFAGDSGDGMQLTGDRFTQETAVFGNDLSTFPNFPAEIRAPAGHAARGVSSFQLHFADHDILTPGDAPDVLVAMNPAALKANIKDLPRGGDLIVNTDEFTKRNLTKVGYAVNPLEDGSLEGYKLHPVPLTSLTVKRAPSTRTSHEGRRAGEEHVRARPDVLALRPADRGHPRASSRRSSTSKPEICRGQHHRVQGRLNYGETTEDFAVSYEVKPAQAQRRAVPQHHRQPGAVLRPVAAGQLPKLPLFLGSLPDHPGLGHPARAVQAQEVRRARPSRPRTRSRPGAALGASFGGSLAVTTTSGPGIAARRPRRSASRVSIELPLLVVDVQRAGPRPACPPRPSRPTCCRPSTGATASPRSRSSRRSTPVRLLLRRHRGGPDGDELPDAGDPAVRRLPGQRLGAVADPGARRPAGPVGRFAFATTRTSRDGDFQPFMRDPQTLARPWAIPGTPGLEHRIGGIEKAYGTGNISYDPDNHDLMVRTRAAKVDGIAASIPPLEVDDPSGNGEAARPRLGLHLRLDRRRGPPRPP